MTELKDDWVRFCEGTEDFDKSHFLTLFHEDHDDQTLAELFKYFSCTDQLVLNVKRFRKAWHHRRSQEVQLSDSDICEIAMKDLRAKSKAYHDFGEDDLADIVAHVTPLITYSRSEFGAASNADWPNCEKQVVLGDYFDEKWLSTDAKTDALLEAFYGTANSYDLQWYLGSPLLDTSINFEHYLTLWEAGFDTALTKDHLLILHMPASVWRQQV